MPVAVDTSCLTLQYTYGILKSREADNSRAKSNQGSVMSARTSQPPPTTHLPQGHRPMTNEDLIAAFDQLTDPTWIASLPEPPNGQELYEELFEGFS